MAPLLLPPAAAGAETLSGRVVWVVGGDTVYVLDAANTQHKIRLSGIDAPERGQPFGTKAKEYLSELVAGKDVRVQWYKRDRYRRIVGKIVLDGEDVNLSLMHAGCARGTASTRVSNRGKTACFMSRRKTRPGARG